MDKNIATADRLRARASDLRESASIRSYIEERRKDEPDYAPSLDAAHFNDLEQQAEDLERAASALIAPPRLVISDAHKLEEAKAQHLERARDAVRAFLRGAVKVRPVIDEVPFRLGQPAHTAIDTALEELVAALFGKREHG